MTDEERKNRTIEALKQILEAEGFEKVEITKNYASGLLDSVTVDIGYRKIECPVCGDGPLLMTKDVIRRVLNEA